MSKQFTIKCPICGERLYFGVHKDFVKGMKYFTTDCGNCSTTLTVDKPNKRKIEVKELIIEYQGRQLKPDGYIEYKS